MIANMDPFSVGSVEVQFDRFLSRRVNRVVVETVFHPRLNSVSLEFKYELLTYRQFWDEAARKQFAASLELYKRDFEDSKLIDNYRKTRAVYGNTRGRLEWETTKYTKTRVSNPTIDIGYRFRENTPFFTTLMRSAREIMGEGDSAPPVDSQAINMYFTRAQASDLVEIFDQARLVELIGKKTTPATDEPAATESPPYREYREYGE